MVFESTDLSAQTIAFDAKGVLYVGTSPDGKVYKISASGEKTIFFDPKCKYIWDLLFGSRWNSVRRHWRQGPDFCGCAGWQEHVFYDSDEAHIRVLAFDGKGQLIAGTEPSGRVLRITARGSQTKDNSRGKRAPQPTRAAPTVMSYMKPRSAK